MCVASLLLQWHRREKAAMRAIAMEKARARRNRDEKWKKVSLPTQSPHFPGLAERVSEQPRRVLRFVLTTRACRSGGEARP